jgi:hypothetical protein
MRIGRTSAIGRGQAVMVSWDSRGAIGQAATGRIDVHEQVPQSSIPIMATTCDGVITPSVGTGWPVTGNGWDAYQPWRGLDLANGRYEWAGVTFYDDTCNPIDFGEVCFSATGRMYLRVGAGGAAAGAYHLAIAGLQFSVMNLNPYTTGSLVGSPRLRVGFVPQNGVARLQR